MTDEIKTGNRNNTTDRGTIRKVRALANEIVSHTIQLEPLDIDPTPEPSEITEFPLDPEKSFVGYGSAVKATRLANGDVKLGGYLVSYSDENDTDLSGEYFDANTDYGNATTSMAWFNHRQPVEYDGQSVQYKGRLPDATITKDEVGIFAEVVLGARNLYEQSIAELGLAGKLGWSSGTAGHLTDYEASPHRKATRIKSWILGLDASLTPTPCEPRNSVIPLKSISVITQETEPEQPTGLSEAADTATVEAVKGEATDINLPTTKEGTEMEITQELLDGAIKSAVEQAIKSYQAAEPATNTIGRVDVIADPADRPFKSASDLAKAIKTAAVTGGSVYDPRLKRLDALKANGANESIQSEGGYLVEEQIGGPVIKPIHENGVFTSRVNRLPTTASYGRLDGVDETSRATGSRWGGVRGYRVAEAGTLTSSKPAFREINWKLKKYAALMYASDELLMDAPQFNAIAQQSAGEEINFMVNDDILNYTGVGGALGVMNSGCLITATRDTASKVLHADILAMWQRLLPRNRSNSAWYINSEVEPQLDALYHTTSVLSPYVGYRPDGVMTIKGRPVIVTEFNAALNTTGDILLADFSDYLFWEKEGINAATSMHLAFLTEEEAFRWTYRCDGQPAYASAITPYKGTNTQSAFVVLSSAT